MPEKKESSSRPEMIDVVNTRAAPFWLPKKINRDANGKKVGVACSSLMLRPGANRIRRSRWDLTKDHPTIVVHVKVGTLVLDADAETVAEHTHTPSPDPLTGVSEMTIEKAKPYIDAATDLDLLGKWRTGESKGKGRAGILELIDARTAALEAGDGDDDTEKE